MFEPFLNLLNISHRQLIQLFFRNGKIETEKLI
jgi:hypothetical protein